MRQLLCCHLTPGCWLLLQCLTGQILADDYRFPAVEPAQALKTFTVQHGFQLQLVAHEPLVADPVDGCFDAQGRLYVAEMHGYPYSEEVRMQQPEPLGKKDAGIIRRLEDRDGDGIFETSTIYASGISWPTSVACWQDGLFVLAPSKLYYFKDEDGDGTAEHREVVLEGFSRANVQGLANNMKWGLDGKLYVSGGTNGGQIVQGDQPLGALSRQDLAFNPRNRKVEFIAGGQQFGHSFDDWGNRFVCSNSNHIQQVLYPGATLEKGTISSVYSPIISIAKEGPAAPVFRKSPAEPWRVERTARRAADPEYRNRLPMTELVPTGFFTSATGVTIYRGDAYGAAFWGNAFIGDVGGNLVHRKTLTRDGTRWIAQRADEDAEWITSTDTWFRPVNFVNGPDGCLYILDMYRETIEHPVSIPDDIKARVDLQSGDDRGRIYRLVGPSGARKPWVSLAERTSAELVEFLGHPNCWQRETAARLLLERQDRTIAEELRQVAQHSPVATGRLQALHVLKNLALLREADLMLALDDPEPLVVAQIVGLCPPFVSNPESAIGKKLTQIAADADVVVKFQMALMLIDVPAKYRGAVWSALANAIGGNEDLRSAVLLAVPQETLPLALELIGHHRKGYNPMLGSVLTHMGLTADDAALQQLVKAIFEGESLIVQSNQFSMLAEGLMGRPRTIADVLQSNPELLAAWLGHCQQMAMLATSEATETRERGIAVRFLGFAPVDIAAPVYEAILSRATADTITLDAVHSASHHRVPEIFDILSRHCATTTPKIRGEIVGVLMVMPGGPNHLLGLVAAEVLSPNDLLPNQREQLRQNGDVKVRQRFAEIPQFAVNPDRKAVLESYASASELPGDLERGRPLYLKHCAACHRLGDVGHLVAPDFVSVKNKSTADLLVAILDPNREAQPNYLGYTLLLNDGRTLTGLVVSETAAGITLRQAEGKDVLVTRAEVESLKSTGLSLMPVGLEKVLTPQDLADIIALIKQ